MRIVSKGLTYVYDKGSEFASKALDGVNLTVESGEFFGIIGCTGSGKSTFIQHINGLVPVQEGSLTVGDTDLKRYTRKEYRKLSRTPDGREICRPDGKKRSFRAYKKAKAAEMKALRAAVGMVFQYPEYQLFGDTVYADVAFALDNFFPSMTAEEKQAAVAAALGFVGLDYDEIKDKSPFDLSGGQKRRVAIAGVIVAKPKILVLDEPVAGLDPQGKKELMALLHKLHGPVAETVIIVSHDMDDVAENCTRVAVFDGGKVVAVLTPSELFAREDILASAGLDLPVTAYLKNRLGAAGIDVETNYRTDDFIRAVSQKYNDYPPESHKNGQTEGIC